MRTIYDLFGETGNISVENLIETARKKHKNLMGINEEKNVVNQLVHKQLLF